jgi:hypothetical protein
MNVPAVGRFLLGGIAACSAQLALGQGGLPTSQPKLLTIVREEVKPGMSADHAKHEAGWPAAFEKAKSPIYYIAITSMTGPSEAWYLAPYESHAAISENMKREDKDATLSAELGRLARRDAEFLNNVTVIQAAGRPDLSFGTFPDVGKARFFEIITFSVRIGKWEQFEEIAKLYGKIRKRVAPDSSYRVYSVIAGMPTPTYFVISSVDDYAKFDQSMADGAKTMKGTTPEEKAQFDKWSEVVVCEVTQRFRVDPVQSYVPKETRDKDPEFWNPK